MDAKEIINNHCENEWRDDYTMRAHCEDEQQRAVEGLKQQFHDEYPLMSSIELEPMLQENGLRFPNEALYREPTTRGVSEIASHKKITIAMC